MVAKKVGMVIVMILFTIIAVGQDADLTRSHNTILRPELVDSGFCGVTVALEGSYTVSLKELIEIDVSGPLVPNCGPDKITTSSDNEGIVKLYHKNSSVWYDTGNNGLLINGIYFKAIKRGEATITVKMENISAPYTTMSFQYRIIVE